MGDFERTFAAGADAVEIVEAFSRGESWPPQERSQPRRGLSPEERKEFEFKRVRNTALSGSVNKLTLIGIVTTQPVVKRSGVIYASFEMATWEASACSFSPGDPTHHSVEVGDERLFDLIENEVSPGTRVFVEGMLRKAAAIPSVGIKESVFVSIRRTVGRLVVLDRPGLEAVPKEPFADID